MNYPDLKVVIKEVCDQVNCPSCKNKYNENDIQVVGTTKNEGVFMVKCNKCPSNIVINASVTRKNVNINPHERTWSPNITKISSDEVLDIHNFLNNYEGDLNTLFNNSNN